MRTEDVSVADIKAALAVMNLKGRGNLVFYDRSTIQDSQVQSLAEMWADDSVDAVFFGVRVPCGKTLRGCVFMRNPVIAKIVSIWERLTAHVHARESTRS